MRRLVDQEERKEEVSKMERRRQRLVAEIVMLERKIITININIIIIIIIIITINAIFQG